MIEIDPWRKPLSDPIRTGWFKGISMGFYGIDTRQIDKKNRPGRRETMLPNERRDYPSCVSPWSSAGRAAEKKAAKGLRGKKKSLNKARRVTKKYVWCLESLEILVLMNVMYIASRSNSIVLGYHYHHDYGIGITYVQVCI